MKLLLDTCALIWSLEDHPCLLPEVRQQIADSTNEVFISAASAWEIEIKKKNQKLNFDCPDDLLEAIIYTGFNLLSISVHHAIKAGSLPLHHKDPFDRILIAQAMLEKMILVTSDTKIIGQYGVPFLLATKI
ncbi:type II toxin-antitoxin system VapC family toxin [Nodularia spumigena CS-591/12]|uniref:type II toxin-antitoxin system VapC family toxin n=1 Tax=Nodularia spumigena TaxID=70799 RepID=UPI00232C1161|nr:type II toxin-antitoxin system VapC family toxin [Nodularia spumigena]MDB9304858.1 type II toxin-antitoxin system VapC family toxin [Nodularia spumigena CS-591/12]MDB9342530.1 type II toxin-antitoxin system VapC family toxin [Nodularia spumigena CS-588/06]MDB9370126.1 type II toxin-antitoxin system VapC family toxin [Nodularia spumigena CS-586/05]